MAEKRIEEICQSINGTIVGRINSVHQYQIKIPQTTLEGLKEITQRLNKLEEVPCDGCQIVIFSKSPIYSI